MKRILNVIIFGALFGASGAFLGANIFNNIHVNSERPNNHCYDGAIVLLAPGGLLEQMLFGKADGWTGPVGDSIRGDDLKEAVFYNALAWPIVFLALACLRLAVRKSCRWISLSGFFPYAR